MATMPTRHACRADLTFHTLECLEETLGVVEFEGDEAISELYRFRIRLCSEDLDLPLEQLFGQPARLEIAGRSGSRHVHGIITSFERSAEGLGLAYYTAEIRPLVWLLTRRQQSRVFTEARCQDMTVSGVIRKVLNDAGVPSHGFRLALAGNYEPHEMVVQYRESDMNFISRLMEREGMFYFFEHSAEGHVMVIADSAVVHLPAPLNSEFLYRDPSGLLPQDDQEYIYGVHDLVRLQMGAVKLDDYDFKRPRVDLLSSAEAGTQTALELVDYPGTFRDKSVGQRYADVRLQEQQCRRRTVELTSNVRCLLPGFRFELDEHPCRDLNRAFLVTRVRHRAAETQNAETQAGDFGARYRTDITAIPSHVPYRSAFRTRKPIVHGSQTAVVVGSAGEEIYTDEYGRVKVQFRWDQEGGFDQHSSCWIRVSQGSAGGQYGMMFLPRVGHEVIVDFLEGDPDSPIITGRVYNADLMPPYALPAEKTKSVIKTHSSKGGGGTNEIRFEDRKDAEQVLIYAQKDFHVRVNNDRVENVDRNHHLTVKEDRFELVRRDRHTEIKRDSVDRIGGNRSLEVKGDVAVKIEGRRSEEVGDTDYLKIGKDLVIEAGTSITFKVGGNYIKIDEDLITIRGDEVKVNCASGAEAEDGREVELDKLQSPIDADEVEPGDDQTYGPDRVRTLEPIAGEFLGSAASGAEAVRSAWRDERDARRRASWIEIELVDELEQPVAGAEYEIIAPDGKAVIPGTLDQNGRAHEKLPEPGTCQISFPKYDRDKWEQRS